MSLLEEIQSEAVDSKSDLGALLRKCKILAARLGSQPLEEWLLWESNGYPVSVGVPEYRIWSLSIKGNFYGPFGSCLTNAPIPIACLPKEARENYQKYKCRQSIASMEQLLSGSEHSTLQVQTDNLALILGENVFEGKNCLQAWAEFGTGHIFELFNNVRNRVLDFSLAIWKEDPSAGENESQSGSTLKASRITQIFNTTVYGGSANLIGTANDSKLTFKIWQGDFQSLENALREKNLQQEDIDKLKTAIEEDDHPTKKGKFGPKVTAWLSRMVKKASEGVWDIGVKIAASFLSEIISKYYGL